MPVSAAARAQASGKRALKRDKKNVFCCHLLQIRLKSAKKMKMGKFLKTAFCALGMFACACANAALVWDANNGWTVQGGVLANVLGENVNVQNALEAMNEGKKAFDEGDYWLALGYYRTVVRDYPNSIFAPEAYYQMAMVYQARGQFENAFESLQEIVNRYPDYPNFNLVVGAEYNLGSAVQGGATPYLWGWIPWFTNYKDAITYYEAVVKNAPYSDYAPIALINIALVAEQEETYEVAFDALDRLINTYPNSLFTSDAYLQMAKVYRKLVEGPEYDQEPTRNAISFFHDYLILFPHEAEVANAEEGLEQMEDTLARSRLLMGDFFYYYRNNSLAASIFYNETITIAPRSPAADEARAQLEKIEKGILAPMTPYDWFWGRYEKPTVDQFEDETRIEELNNDEFEIMSLDAFLSTPGAVVEERLTPDGQPVSTQYFAPLFGEDLDDFLMQNESANPPAQGGASADSYSKPPSSMVEAAEKVEAEKSAKEKAGGGSAGGKPAASDSPERPQPGGPESAGKK